MTIQEVIEKHLEEKCKGCKIKDCKGINITRDGRAKCEKED